MSDKVTAPRVHRMKRKGERIVCLTAYDAPSARIADAAGVDVILVGDSVGNTLLGYETTVPVTMDDMLHHTRAARKGCARALLVADMPFGSYGASISETVRNAVLLAQAGAEAVKLEGAFTQEIEAITRIGIPVMGHVGMTPQSINAFGGFKVQGRGDQGEAIVDAAQAIADSGAFAIVLELIPRELARKVTDSCSAPTIGIGAGPECDGQIQVFHDVLGLNSQTFKHAKKYVDGFAHFTDGLTRYADEVRKGVFPDEEHSF